METNLLLEKTDQQRNGLEKSGSKRVYLDYNATTPLEPDVIEAITVALQEAWGNPSSTYTPGRKAKEIISHSRESIAKMVGGCADDIIFMSGGTEANNFVFHTAIKYFWNVVQKAELNGVQVGPSQQGGILPHLITSNVEHDSVRLVAQQLMEEKKAEVTFIPVSKVTGQVEVDDVMSAIRPTTCLISVMLANNETGVIMPVGEISKRIRALDEQRPAPRVLLHTDAAQAIGKLRVDSQDLGVDYLTIVGHKFYAPRIGALYVKSPVTLTPIYPLFYGGGQENNLRPGTENTPMIAGLGKAAELVNKNLEHYMADMCKTRDYLENCLEAVFGTKVHFNNRFNGVARLPNTCNVSFLGVNLQGRRVLACCQRLLASVGAACHSSQEDRPSHILLSCGISPSVAANAIRLSVGRETTTEDIDVIIKDLREAVNYLEGR
ncbi:selenocysteine lyase [Erpetoichthys calabaricus]|uniref:Selenocysteine lyase n=1 Tax=Erpetoichthys calabaricus TaxID=27687 RepID=A0A8C4S827_ERPCA|nr:selenocysteine lyase [Erpetoichthys calabaricus]XP_028650647.1 selenocysteine lyase [Erpetoichthys calabaricus]